MSGTELQIFHPSEIGSRLLNLPNLEKPPGLHAQLMDRHVRGSGNLLQFDSVFTIQKVNVVDPVTPGGEMMRTTAGGPIRNGDRIAIRSARGGYLEADETSGVVTRGASTVGKNAVFTFESGSDLAVRLFVDRAGNGSVSAIYLSVEDGYSRVPVPATFDLSGSPFSVYGQFDANTWIPSKFEWGTAPADIVLTRIDRRPTDPWPQVAKLRLEKGEPASWALGRDGATFELWDS
ncbi:hypothetical protein LQ757_11150 [Agromyces sp. SYSU K20354]|uniref:hypothetical protein n=1 Tax=Agromyces cavernae TaxID=2898659 RepID=UPI001E29E010|nr:hypothetical protein [Agromyces cavernae]MCD2442830.1 hypothetical protein [Agromyces cavernae]